MENGFRAQWRVVSAFWMSKKKVASDVDKMWQNKNVNVCQQCSFQLRGGIHNSRNEYWKEQQTRKKQFLKKMYDILEMILESFSVLCHFILKTMESFVDEF